MKNVIVRNQVQVKTSALFQCLVYLSRCNIPTISTGMNHVNNKGKIILIHSTSPLKQLFSILPILYFCIFYPLCFCFAEFSTRVDTRHSGLEYFDAGSLSLQSCCLRLAHHITVIHSRLASNAVVSSLFDRISTCWIVHPLLDARAGTSVPNCDKLCNLFRFTKFDIFRHYSNFCSYFVNGT